MLFLHNKSPTFLNQLISGIKAPKSHLIYVHHISKFPDLKPSPFLTLGQALELLPLNWSVTGGSNSNKGKMDQTWSILILTYPQIAD